MAINFHREPPPKWLVDMDPHLNDIHQRVPKIKTHMLFQHPKHKGSSEPSQTSKTQETPERRRQHRLASSYARRRCVGQPAPPFFGIPSKSPPNSAAESVLGANPLETIMAPGSHPALPWTK